MDQRDLIGFYETEGREELRYGEDGPHHLEFLTASRFLEQALSHDARVLDNCAGGGAYAFHLAERGRRVTAGDLVPRNVAILQARQRETPLLEEIYQGDATDLSRFGPDSFDAVLCMGALYHLHEEQQRRRAVTQAVRLLPRGGTFACTYMNRYAVILHNSAGSLDNLDEILSYLRNGKEGVFYAATPREMEELLQSCGLTVQHHVALDGVSNFLRFTTGLLDDEGLRRWREYHLATCQEPSLLGYSYHNLLIARKL